MVACILLFWTSFCCWQSSSVVVHVSSFGLKTDLPNMCQMATTRNDHRHWKVEHGRNTPMHLPKKCIKWGEDFKWQRGGWKGELNVPFATQPHSLYPVIFLPVGIQNLIWAWQLTGAGGRPWGTSGKQRKEAFSRTLSHPQLFFRATPCPCLQLCGSNLQLKAQVPCHTWCHP